jgi:isopenicillin N synthase-like dioxygenase
MPFAGITPLSLEAMTRDLDGFARDIVASFRDTGFAILAPHGLDQGLIDAVMAESRAFFALPEAVKRGYVIPGGRGQRGYVAFGAESAKDETLPDLKEFWHVGREAPAARLQALGLKENVWPAERPGFQPATLALYGALEGLGRQLLSAIARGLGLADAFFEMPVTDGDSILRLLHYPPIAADAEGVRAGAHEDINVITLLLGADEGGLQLLRADGSWLTLNPPPGSLVVNVGDMLQRLTAGSLRSTTHRVINPPPERRAFARYSIPFFLHFAPDYVIDPASVGLSGGDDPRFSPIRADDYLAERLAEIGLS